VGGKWQAGIDTLTDLDRILGIAGPTHGAGTGEGAGEKRIFDSPGSCRKRRGGTDSTDANSIKSVLYRGPHGWRKAQPGPRSRPYHKLAGLQASKLAGLKTNAVSQRV